MLLLDSEALSALAHGPAARRDKVRALMSVMVSRGYSVSTVAAVLAEVIRGRPQDAGVFACLKRDRLDIRVVDRYVGVRAGHLLGRAGADSGLAVDAFLIAVADLAGGAVVATVDESDLASLAAGAGNVSIQSIV